MLRTNYFMLFIISLIFINLLILPESFALDTLLVEDFESGFPADWEILNGGDDEGGTWFISNEQTGSLNTTYMRVDSRAAGPGGIHLNELLITPSLDLSDYNRVYVEFYTRYNNLSGDHASIDVSTDGGSSWSSALLLDYDFSAYPHTEDISSYCSREEDTKIAFHYNDEGLWAWYWGVDNVVVTAEYIDFISPEIIVTEYPPISLTNEFIPITASTWDDVGIQDIQLIYGYWDPDLLAIMNPDTLDMNEQVVNELYDIEIPDSSVTETGTIAFYVIASDPTGNTGRSPENNQEYHFIEILNGWNEYREHHEVAKTWYNSTGSDLICQGDDVTEFLSFSENGFNNFEWYGNEYDGLYVCSNGYISFSENTNIPTPLEFPSTETPNDIIAIFMTDLSGDQYGGEITYTFVQNRYLLINWNNVHPVDDENSIFNGQIVLDFLTSYVLFNYGQLDGDILDYEYSVGYENSSGSSGSSILDWDLPDIEAESAFIIHPPAGRLQGSLENNVTGGVIGNCMIQFYEAGTDQMLFITPAHYYGAYFYYLPPGVYDIEYHTCLANNNYFQSINDVNVTLNDTTIVNTVLPELIASFENSVVDSLTNEAYEGVEIIVYSNFPDGICLELETDENGYCSSNMYPGEFTVECRITEEISFFIYDVLFEANGTVSLDWLIPDVHIEEGSNFPYDYALHQNYPNPFNPETTIAFSLRENQEVTLKVFNLLGREVITLINSQLPAGLYNYHFDASTLTSGTYFYEIETENFNDMKKMILVK